MAMGIVIAGTVLCLGVLLWVWYRPGGRPRHRRDRTRPTPPAVGTAVTAHLDGQSRTGVVQPCGRRLGPGVFPVRFDDGAERLITAADVAVTEPRP